MKPNSGISEKDFRNEIERMLIEARNAGKSEIIIISGDVHRNVGGYPSSNHRMPTCCDIMRSMMRDTDVVMEEPAKGKGASLKIKYKL